MSRFRKGGRLAAAAVAGAAAVLTATAGAVLVADDATATAADASGALRAVLHDAQGAEVGTVRFLPQPGGKVAVRAATSSLTAGFHGFHVHAVGRCEPPFASAGGHFNPGGAGHGGHAGDLPVLLVAEDGAAWAEFETDGFALVDLLDADGSAVIVHAAPDNYANVPARYAPSGPDAVTLATGDAGGRIACGVVERS